MEEKDLDIILQEYVVTANSGKYKSWDEVNSKFPELKDYDSKVLQEYVVTANSGKYNSWQDINSKFPEFSQKKNEKNQPQEEAITEDSSTVAEPLQESGGESRQDRGLENPMALYGKYQQNNNALSEINNQIDYQESLDSPNQESIAELKRKRDELSSEVKTTASKLVSPISNKELPKYYNENGEIKEEYVTTNVYDFKVPDLEKIKEDADRLFTDPALKRKYQKDIENSLQFSIDVPKEKLQEKVNDVYKNEFGQSLDEAIEKSQVDAFNSTYGGELNKELSSVNYKIKEVQDLYSEELSKINEEATKKAEQLGNEYKQAIAEIQQRPAATDDEIKKLQREADSLYSNYSKSVDEIISNAVDVENQYNAKINQYAQKQYENYNNKVKSFTEEFQKEYKISPEIAKNLQSASNKAASELLKEANQKKEENIKLQGAYSGSGYSGRLVTSTLSSLGGVLSGWATAFGGTGEFGDKVQQYFQPAVAPIKSFKDLTLYSLTESSGNLTGSMLPSVLAGITSGALTRNAGLTTRIVATGAAGWATETVDIAGRQYKEALERTGSTAEAENAASEAIDGQIMLAPTYLLEGLPFVGAFKKISNPVLRIGTGATVEYVGGVMQEYPQGLMEEQISKTGDVKGFAQRASLESFTETALNYIPAAGLGAVGAINKEVDSILKTNPDIGMQQLGDVIYKKGKAAANLQISQLYSQGMIDKETFEFLGTQIEEFDTENSNEYNAIKFKRDQVAMSIDKESDPVKQKVLRDTVKAYDTMLEMSILGETVAMPQIEANGVKYAVITNNPIEWLKLREEEAKNAEPKQERTTVEQYGDKKEVAIDEELSEDELESLAKDLETFEEELPRDVTEEVKKEVEENRQKNLSESMPKAKALEGANVTIFDKKAKIIYVKEDGKGGYVVKLKDDKGLVRRIKGSDAEVLINNLATLADETISPQATKAQSVEENRRQKQREAKAKQKEAKAKQLAEQKKVKNKEKADRVKAREQKIKERNKQSLSEFREKQKQEKSEEKEIRDYNKSVEDEFKNEVREEERFLKEYEKELKEELDRKLKAEEARIVEFEGESYYVEKVEKNKYKIIGGNGRAVQGSKRSAISAVYDTEVGKIKKAETKATEEKLLDEMIASEDRVEAALQKAIDFFDLSQNKAYKNSAMSTIGVVEIPAWAIKSTLQIVKMTYKATKNLAEAISAGYAYISTNHPEVKENDFSKFIVNELKKQLPSKSQKPSSGAKKPQEKQKTVKTATVAQKSKQSPQDVKKETEGLTEKEVAKQGVEEIVQAYKNKLKEAKQKANEKISDEKQKARILKGNIKVAKDILTGIIEESIPKGVMLGKSILKDVANALTPKQIERVADRIERSVEKIQRRNKINDIKSKQAKVKKKLPNFTNQQESVKEILNVDLTQVKDLGILQEIENELDAALESDVAKLDPKRMSELLDKLEQKSQPESKTTSKRKVSEKIQSLKESDKNSDKKIKELQSLNRALDKTLGLNQINQDDYNDALSIIEKELELLEKDRQEDTKKLNKDSVERLSKLDEKPFSKVQKDEIKRLRDVAGKSTKYRDALKLNEIIDELELGYIPVKQMDEYRNDAISYQESNNLSTQINKRTALDSIKNKLASLLGLQREGTLRGSKKNKSFSDALNILELNNISSWNDLFGLGRKEGISNFLSPLFTNIIATTSENVRRIMNNYFTIKYPISPFKKGLTKDKEIALIMMRKQGDWEVTEGMDTDYWGELLSEKNIEEAKKQYNGDKSDISLKKIIKIYESLPKRKGKLDYEGYFENLKGVEKRMNYFLTKLAEDNAPLQEIANQRNGKEFVKRDSRYYLTDIVLRDSGGALEDGLGGLSFVLSNGVSLDAGVGETRIAGKKVKPILLDLDRIVNKQTTETIRDYNLSSNLKAIRKTFIRTIPQLTEPNARALMSMFGQALSIRMQAEYGIRAADSSRNFIGKLLGAARAYFLAGFKRVGIEFVAEVVRSLPATRKRYVPNAVKAIIQARAIGIKLNKELLARTGSPYLKKAYLESSAADSQVTADTKRTIFGRISDFVKGGSDGMMGVSSNVVFPQVWLPEFLYQFKQLTGKDFDVKNYSDAYFNKNEKDIRSAAIIADTNAERIFGGSTRAARRTKAKWLGTPVIGLIQSIQGKFTGDYSFGNKYKYVDPYTNFGMLNTFLSNFAGIEAYNTFTRGLKGILYGENVSRGKAGQYLLFGIISGTLYTYLRDEIMTILFGKGEDEEDERETEEKFIDAMINNIIFLSVGQYGQSAQLALRTFVGIYEDRLDDEQKKRFRRLSQDRFNVYPLNFGYGSITRAYDNLIPFLGETISTISQSKDVIMNAKEIEDGITLSEEEMMTLKAIELTNNMLKLAFTVKGTQIPMQRDIDRVLKALDKIESGKEITRSEYELLETYNFIPIIDEIYENADIKE